MFCNFLINILINRHNKLALAGHTLLSGDIHKRLEIIIDKSTIFKTLSNYCQNTICISVVLSAYTPWCIRNISQKVDRRLNSSDFSYRYEQAAPSQVR